MNFTWHDGKKTYAGLAITALAVILPLLGVEASDAEVTQLVESIVAIIGLSVAFIGRKKARKGLTLATPEAKKTGTAALLILCLVLPAAVNTGCAGLENKTPAELAAVTVDQLEHVHAGLHGQWLSLKEQLPADYQDDLAKAGIVLDEAALSLFRMNQLAELWLAGDETAKVELDLRKSQILSSLDIVSAWLFDLGNRYLTDNKEGGHDQQ